MKLVKTKSNPCSKCECDDFKAINGANGLYELLFLCS